jgi:ectoine hydroxylase-related dioxygenase (phytanoyl-CoA dioxygenase family)
MDNDKVRKLILDSQIGKMTCDLTGEDGMRIWHDQALIKEPWGNPTGWHLDNPYWSYHNPNALTIWVALDDATIENGCMYFVPGAHKTAITEDSSWEYLATQVEIDQNVGGLFQAYPQWADKEAVAVSIKAGSCSVHSGLMPHGAGANMTPGRRRAMTCGYMPDGSTFNGLQNVLPDSYFNSLEVGDVLDNDDQNPLIYHVSKPYVTG